MLSVLLGTTTITMNRGEQETLYRQARNLRLHQEIKAQQLNKPRHHSYGNIHQIHSTTLASRQQGMNLRSTNSSNDEQRPLATTACDDLVLSVLKSPLRDQSLLSNLSSVAATSVNSDSVEGGSVNRMSTVTTLTTTTTLDNVPSSHGRPYSNLQASEDDLADDVELAMETTELNDSKNFPIDNTNLSPYGLRFLRRFRAPKFEAHHHRRVPTPMRRKHNRGRSKSTADILDGVNTTNPDEEVAIRDGENEGMEGGKCSSYFTVLKILLLSFQKIK
jgi:hypothetical protein